MPQPKTRYKNHWRRAGMDIVGLSVGDTTEKDLVDELYYQRAASVFARRYGADVVRIAMARALERMEAGDVAGAALWGRVASDNFLGWKGMSGSGIRLC